MCANANVVGFDFGHFSPHFRMCRVRIRRSAAALAIYMVMYKVKCADVVCAGPDHAADEQGPGIDTNRGPRNADRRQKGSRELSRVVAVRRIPSFSAPIETVCFAGLAKG